MTEENGNDQLTREHLQTPHRRGGISIKAQKRREIQALACSLAEIDVTGGPEDTDLLIRGIIPIPNYTTLWHPIIIAEKPDEVSPNGFLLVTHQA